MLTNRYFFFILLTVLSQSAAALFNKYAAIFLNNHGAVSTFYNPYFFAMLAALGFQTVVWQTALRHYPLSFAYMLMSLTYPLILLQSYFFLGETVSPGNIAGTVIIMAGVIILVRGKKK